MSLPAHQQSLLNSMDRALEARDPWLASIFAIFNRMTRDDGPPRAERLAPKVNPVVRWLRAPAAWAREPATIPIVLVASLMAAIIALGLATSGWTACPSASLHGQTPPKVGWCRSAATESAK